jgi:hypothetical protein
MPKRSEREEYASKFTEQNPYSGKSAKALYSSLRWGNGPTEIFEIEGPEEMASLGILAQIWFVENKVKIKFAEDNGPFLAVGKDSNYLYIVNRNEDGSPTDVSSDFDSYKAFAHVRRTDYYSDKNNEPAYYYHKHEKPYPLAYISPDSNTILLVPDQLESGHPSYIVREEGIIG